MENYLLELDTSQQKAAKHKEGPIMILAGAGSGKTRVITYRVINLINQDISPNNILALTFTNKAANEMRERIKSLVGLEARKLWMGTFHSIFSKILRIKAESLGYDSNFSIYDITDAKSLIKQITKEFNLDEDTYNTARILNRISWAKNNLITSQQYSLNDDIIAYDEKSSKSLISKIYEEYEKRCLAANAMDFDDLLLKFYYLISKNDAILEEYQNLFKYILIDEYQDTNHLQYKIIKLLASKHKNICVVGDDAQSIYSFRGATVQNILNFQTDYPDANICKLEQNYRSTQTIVNAANSIIKNNENRLDKNVFSKNEKGEKIDIYYLGNESEEAMAIAREIYYNHTTYNIPYNKFGILYRTNAQSRPIEEALRKVGIPYNIYGGLSFYNRKEIKDTIAYLRLSINPNDEESFKRIINYPRRGIGQTTIDKILNIIHTTNTPLIEVLNNIENHLSGKIAQSIKSFADLINNFTEVSKDMNAYEMVSYVLKESGITSDLYNDKTIEGLSKFNNLQEIVNAAKQFISESIDLDQEPSLANFLQEIALYNSIDDLNNQEDIDSKVSLMTVHSAKGLEFTNVYITGVEKGLFPSQMSVSEANIEEERRLFYVAVTRAQKKLIITNVKYRYKYGLIKECEPSIFIKEMELCAEDNIIIHNNFKKSELNKVSNISTIKKPKPNNINSTTITRNNKFVPLDRVPKPNSHINRNITTVEEVKTGTKVKHERFGVGEIISVNNNNSNTTITVDFGKLGTKQILLSYAKLEILP